MFITDHAKQRYRERLYSKATDFLISTVAKEALTLGLMPIQFYDTEPEVYHYLQHVQQKYKIDSFKIKVLKDVAFIFTKDTDGLITLYKLNKEKIKETIYNLKKKRYNNNVRKRKWEVIICIKIQLKKKKTSSNMT